MKKTVLCITLSLSFAATTVHAQTPRQAVQKFYPKYSQKYGCYQVSVKNAGDYCVRHTRSETRQTAQGRLAYLLFTGSMFDFAKGEPNGAHAYSGLAGIFVLKQTGSGWKMLAALPRAHAGAFGNAPEAKHWAFHEFGQDKWGFLTRHADMHHGYAGSAYLLFAHNGAGKITQSSLTAQADNEGALGDCSENFYKGRNNTAAERRECLGRLYSLSSEIKILKDGRPSAGFYPLQLTVSGYHGLKKYRNQAFTARYNAAKGYYTAPKDYPLADKEF